MKCTKCGSENEAGARFCLKCGATLQENNAASGNANPNLRRDINVIGKATGRRTGMLVWGIILSCFGLLFPGILMIIKGSKGGSKKIALNSDNILPHDKEVLLNATQREVMLIDSGTWDFQFLSGNELSKVITYQEINRFELMQDNEVVTTTASSGGLTGMAIGGLLGGGIGMVAGALAAKNSAAGRQNTSVRHIYTLIITFNTLAYPAKTIVLDNLNIAVEVNNVLDLYNKFLVKQNGGTPATEEKEAESAETYDEQMKSYDVLLKYKKLLDENIITKEEFEEKKKEIIGEKNE